MDSSPPCPPGRWLRGHLPDVQRDPAGFFLKCAIEYGGIVRLRLGPRPAYLVSEPELAREILIERPAGYVKTTRYNRLRAVLGEGLVLSEGETWKRQHAASRPAFQDSSVDGDAGWMMKVADTCLDRWDADGAAIDLERRLVRLTQELMGRWCFGVAAYLSMADELERCLDVLRNLYTITRTGLPAFFIRHSPFRRRIFNRNLQTLDRLVYEAIRLSDGGLISHLMRSQAGNERSIRDQIVSVFIPAYETSSTSLTWACLHLARQTAARDRIEMEASGPFGGLTFTERFLQESLRLHPPAGWFTRTPVADERVGPYTIPAGSMVILCPYAVHRLPRIWKDAERFDPDRFLPETAAARPPLAWFPFGAGPRACIGGRLGMIQMKVILSRIARRFRLEVESGTKIEAQPGGTIRIRGGLPVIVHRRSMEVHVP